VEKLFLLTIFVSGSLISNAQNFEEIRIKGIHGQKPLPEFLAEIETSEHIKFFYIEEWLNQLFVDESFNGLLLKQGIDQVLTGTDITWYFLFDYAVIFSKDPKQAMERQRLLRQASISRKQIDKHVIGDQKQSRPNAKYTLSGTVVNRTTGSRMAGVVIHVNERPVATTDITGEYKLMLPAGNHVISFHYVNFVDQILDLGIYKNGVIDVSLEDTPTLLEEVVISDQAIVNVGIGQTTLQTRDLKRLPSFVGEIDVIKQLQTQAGVTTVGEVATGFNVRGGGVDQNLILYDGTPVFNTSHALGFFTAFNAEAIDKVKFYRAGIPAEYGGRVSSVLSLTSREGPMDKWRGSAGIGIISSNFNIGGPIKRDTTAILASIRTSYSNWMLRAVQSNYKNLRRSHVAFYDGSLKFTHKFNAGTKLTFSGYVSNDEFSLANDTLYSWNNMAASLRLDKSFGSKLYSSVTLAMGQYGYSMHEDDPELAFDLSYQISYPSLKIDFTRDGPHELSFGLQNTLYNFEPGRLKPGSPESDVRNIEMDVERSIESACYFSDGFYPTQNLYIEAGMRLSMFNRIGPGKVYRYEPGQPLEPRNITDSTIYGDNEIMNTYFGYEPRLSMRYVLSPNASVKFAYNRVYQYVHMITNTAAVTPVDIWQSSNTYFKPQIGDQASLGYYRNMADNSVEFFVEGYYKIVNNILDFKDGASLILNDKLETALLKGVGKSYGVEISATKIKGKLLGTVNYAYSRSLRQVNGDAPSEQINDGHMYPANYDQPHIVNLNWRYSISRRHFFSGNFTYHTGRPFSLPMSIYEVDGVAVADYSLRNQYRLSSYHRLDLAFIIEGNHRRRKLFDGTWVVSLYNVYSRKNAYSVFFEQIPSGNFAAHKLSVIGSIIPSVSYNVKF
jgi:hypothetical protein